MNKKYYPITLFLIAIPIIIYLYFLKWKTGVIYGDDLLMYTSHSRLNSISEKINLLVPLQKYRPIHGLSMHVLMEWFQKHLNAYYLFNVTIQTINTFIFAAILNLFLKSPFFSLLLSLSVGLSRFSLFNTSQLLNGGALEGLAITFFLLSLFFIATTWVRNDFTVSQKYKAIILGILFGNLSMYTHERYIVIFPFIIAVIILSPVLKALTQKQRISLSVIALASIILNAVIKKYIFSMPFFTGTAGTSMTFSFSSATSFFIDAVLSIFQINRGPEYLAGIPFSSLSTFNKALILLVFFCVLTILMIYLFKTGKAYISKQKNAFHDLLIFLFLLTLFILCLVPAVSTIRLEQRWLQAPFCVFVLMIAIALNNFQFKNNSTKSSWLFLFTILFLYNDFNYLNKGADNLYMMDSERLVSKFKKAIDANIIRRNTAKLYIWEKHRDSNAENAIIWDLGDGSFFDFYQNKSKKLIFVDSIYQRSYSFPLSSFINFNPNTEQIIYIDKNIIDVTNEYLQDSLKSFTAQKIRELSSPNQIQYDQKQLLITNDNFDKFSMSGFYENENGIRWTNGNASIGLLGDYAAKDTLSIEMTTYMPPICKNIKPEISIIDENNNNYQPLMFNQKGDHFFYKFYFEKSTIIQKINISSETIDASPDSRVLSFPFISLEIKK